jgi:hypothetical protein
MVECETIIVLKRKRLDGVVPVFYQDSNGDRGVAIWKKDKFVTLSFEKMKHDIVAWMAIPNGVI